MTIGSRLAFTAWRLYRKNALARRFMTPRLERSARKKLVAHATFVGGSAPSDAWAKPRPASDPVLYVNEDGLDLRTSALLFGWLNHWGARYAVVPTGPTIAVTPDGKTGRSLSLLQRPPAGTEPAVRSGTGGWLVSGAVARGLREPGAGEALAPTARLWLDAAFLSPGLHFLVDPHEHPLGYVFSSAIDVVVGRRDWRAPLPPLVSARVDDVTGKGGLGWLAALEDHGIRPSIGTLHDEWLASGEHAVHGIVEASRRGCSVSPHAFSMDRFIWYDAPRGRPFSHAEMQAHVERLALDAKGWGLRFGKTLNAHFDVIGSTAVDAAHALGFRYALGEHALDQDWREAPRARDPLGTPLHAYGPLDPAGKLFGFQAAGAIASSAAPLSRYDWLRNFIALDRKTGKPIRESLDRAGAVRQGVTQLLSALFAGFPAYLLAHEMHLDALGRELVGELLSDVLREVRARVPEVRMAAFDELPEACARHTVSRAG